MANLAFRNIVRQQYFCEKRKKVEYFFAEMRK
jgi:hypothetical protein